MKQDLVQLGVVALFRATRIDYIMLPPAGDAWVTYVSVCYKQARVLQLANTFHWMDHAPFSVFFLSMLAL